MNTPRRRDVLLGGAALSLAACAHAPGASKASKLYYLGQSKVFALDAAGGTPKTLVDKTDPAEPRGMRGVNDGIALDLAKGHIYWSNMGRAAENDGYILRSDLDGGNVKTIVPAGGAFTPKQIKLSGGKIYWSDREGMAVMRCAMDGSNIETLVRTGDPVAHKGDEARWCVGMAVDEGRGHVYWTQKGGDNSGKGVIRRAPLKMKASATPETRTDVETLFSGLPEPIDLDLDLVKRDIYWTDRGDNTISRAPMDIAGRGNVRGPGDRVILHTGLKEAIGVALDFDGGRMAFTSLGGEVGVANLDGSGARMLATDQGLLTGIAWG